MKPLVNRPKQMTKNQYIPALDGWRGLAILALLIGHFFPVRGLGLGAAGVNLFFVLSGFLMTRILFIDRVPISTFYRRRISRIFPALFVFLLSMICTYAIVGIPIEWHEVAAAIGLVINYFPGKPGAAVMPFGHVWSLCVEEHSYILLSGIAVAHRMKYIRAKPAIGLATISFVTAGLVYLMTYTGQHFEFDRWIHSEVSAFGIFVSGFVLLQNNHTNRPAVPIVVIPGLLLFGLATHWWSVSPAVRTFVGVSALALAVNLIERAPRRVSALLSFQPLRKLGLWSFSIYLWQQPFYLLVNRTEMPRSIGLLLAICSGVASFYLIEKPARNFLNRKWRSGSGLKTTVILNNVPIRSPNDNPHLEHLTINAFEGSCAESALLGKQRAE
jgi:peptidoglycan/LPS O-acetylase OafA/YrhL